ncbi:uncharacterized protein F5147DRAFT_769766 [Suillus discolor]|uniref:Uncharacterized protein n=1 Tax=Suillus discolor TaxID=1912936 RepID=A0A9P7JY12_9AGAM|nr:uncharacterized protein F5147DRAFT_769766 [Suillus discolor]KAG2115308.1 hypothetical protein F5147DRAFT_769766 [Suillus discolor]
MSETTVQPVPPLQNVNEEAVIEQQVSDEMLHLELEEASEVEAKLDILLNEGLNDFPDNDESKIAQYASNIVQNSITDQTCTKHVRIIKAYIIFHMKQTPNWDPKVVTRNTPYDDTRSVAPVSVSLTTSGDELIYIFVAVLHCNFNSSSPYTVVSLCLTIRDSGLPTRFHAVSKFIIGLEKTKARQGEVSQSAQALLLDDMYCLHDYCMMHHSLNNADRQCGIVQYMVFLFAWLLVFRVEEALSLTFEIIDALPNERAYFDVDLGIHKNAQTDVSQRMHLCANDKDSKICPKRALIRLVALYGENHDCTGLLFLVINMNGTVTTQPLSSTTIS